LCHERGTGKIGKQNLDFVRCHATPNRHLTNKNASLAFGASWRILSEKSENSSWLSLLNEARTLFERDE